MSILNTKTVTYVKRDDLEKLICDYYGLKEFCICLDQESFDEEVKLTVKKAVSLSAQDLKDLCDLKRELKNRDTIDLIYVLDLLMADLAQKELVPTGDYIIDVTW